MSGRPTRCPWCGSDDLSVNEDTDAGGVFYFVTCGQCSAEGPCLTDYDDPDTTTRTVASAWAAWEQPMRGPGGDPEHALDEPAERADEPEPARKPLVRLLCENPGELARAVLIALALWGAALLS